MKKNKMIRVFCMICALAFLSGCGSEVPPVSSAVEEPSVDVQGDEEVRSESQSQSYITVAEAKAAALENVGLLEENVKFVRINLDSGNGSPEYDLEFISEDAEYDYVVNALTGEIISMICENGTYDMEKVPTEVTQAAEEQPIAGEVPSEAAQDAEGQPGAENVPSEASKAAEGQPGTENVPSEASKAAEGQPGTENVPSEAPKAAEGKAKAENAPAEAQQAVGGQAEPKQQYIGVEAAKKIALDHAGLQAEAVRFVHAHLEYDDGCWQYDVEFHKDSTEYDYDIDALSGAIISYDYDAEYYQHGQDSSSGSGQITQDRAKQIALEYAGIAETDTQYLTIEFDYDDGRAEYQVEWYVGRMEYSCDIDANTGAILSFEKEYD